MICTVCVCVCVWKRYSIWLFVYDWDRLRWSNAIIIISNDNYAKCVFITHRTNWLNNVENPAKTQQQQIPILKSRIFLWFIHTILSDGALTVYCMYPNLGTFQDQIDVGMCCEAEKFQWRKMLRERQRENG